MAQSGYTPLSLYYSATASTAPLAANLVAGELALNTNDGKLYYKDSSGVVQVLATKASSSGSFGAITATSITNSGLTSGRVVYTTTGGLETTSANLLFNGTTLTSVNDASISGLTVGKGNGAGSENTAFGYLALSATSGNSNTAFGWSALRSNTTATGSSAFGDGALYSNTTGTNNTALGLNSLVLNTTGASNVAVGNNALNSNTTASNNTAVGYQAGYSSSTAANCTFIGNAAGYSSTGADNTFVGFVAGYYSTGTQNTYVGRSSGAVNGASSGSYNSTLGYTAGASLTSGASNTAIGNAALYSNTTASNNTAVGYQAGYSNTTGQYNCALGYQAGYNSTVYSYNNFFGYQAGQGNGGNEKNGFGSGALQLATGSGNNAFGSYAGSAITSGTYNLCVGHSAGSGLTTSSYNTLVGPQAGFLITTGAKNTIIGRYDGNSGGLDIRTASNYIVLSDGDGNPRVWWDTNGVMYAVASLTDNTPLLVRNTQATRPYGMEVNFSAASPNNTTQNFFSGTDSTNTKVVIYSSGTISNRTGTYNTISDIKIKQDVKDATSQWDDIKAIRFRKYRLIDDVKANPNAPYLMGVVAQELQQTSPNLIDECVDKEGIVTLGVKQSIIFMKATKALQEAMERIETLEAKVTALEAQLQGK